MSLFNQIWPTYYDSIDSIFTNDLLTQNVFTGNIDLSHHLPAFVYVFNEAFLPCTCAEIIVII